MRDGELEIMQQYMKYSRGQLDGNETEIKNPANEQQEDYSGITDYYTSLDNIDDIDRMVFVIKQLLQKAWGDDCPPIVDQYPTNRENANVKMPMIVYDYYDRQIAENTKKVPQLMTTYKYNGEQYEIYSQFFDCTLEFNILDTTASGAKVLAKRFEIFLQTYMQYLKYIGVSNIYFLSEPKSSPVQIANQDYQRRALKYKVRIERRFLKRYGEVIGTVQVVLGVDGKSSNLGIPGVYFKMNE